MTDKSTKTDKGSPGLSDRALAVLTDQLLGFVRTRDAVQAQVRQHIQERADFLDRLLRGEVPLMASAGDEPAGYQAVRNEITRHVQGQADFFRKLLRGEVPLWTPPADEPQL
jgi:hypothetical protein